MKTTTTDLNQYLATTDTRDASYWHGPWEMKMATRAATDGNRKPTGQLSFFGRFLHWCSVEAYIRSAMRAEEAWGCEI